MRKFLVLVMLAGCNHQPSNDWQDIGELRGTRFVNVAGHFDRLEVETDSAKISVINYPDVIPKTGRVFYSKLRRAVQFGNGYKIN